MVDWEDCLKLATQLPYTPQHISQQLQGERDLGYDCFSRHCVAAVLTALCEVDGAQVFMRLEFAVFPRFFSLILPHMFR